MTWTAEWSNETTNSIRGSNLPSGRYDIANARGTSAKGWPRHFHVDRVGLLLDMDRQTLTVYRDGKKVGVMVRPGMANPRGKPIAPLVGPLRWAVDVCGERDSEVAIERQPLPAEPKPAEVVASLRAMGFERELCE